MHASKSHYSSELSGRRLDPLTLGSIVEISDGYRAKTANVALIDFLTQPELVAELKEEAAEAAPGHCGLPEAWPWGGGSPFNCRKMDLFRHSWQSKRCQQVSTED